MRLKFAISLGVCLLLSANAARAQEYAKRSLKGLDAFFVLVEDLPAEIERDGLAASQVKTDVELQLRRAGIKLDDKSPNYLDVNIQVLKASQRGPQGYAYFISVSVIQPALLIKDKSYAPLATTWQDGVLGTMPPEHLREIRNYTLDYVDRFINDYLAVNPKQ